MKNKNSTFRIRLIYSFLLCIGAVLFVKLYLVQIVNGSEYSERADRQYVRLNQDFFERGSIFFEAKDGSKLSVASLKTGFMLVINPRLIKSATTTYKLISEILPIDEELFLSKAGKQNDQYEEIAKQLDEEVALKIKERKIPGVTLVKQKWRFYSSRGLASQILGFVGYKGTTQAGRYGLESFYDDVLGRNPEALNVNFFAEIFSDLNKTVRKGEDIEGDLVATIEPTVEAYVEDTLEKINKKWQADLSGAIVIDPKTGKIYAMAGYPSFDPNSFGKEKDPSVFSNSLVERVYEMGSIVKPLTMAAGIDAGVVTATTTYQDKGFLVIDGKRISNFDGKGRGVVSMQEVLNQSLNTGAAFVENLLGNQRFTKYMYSFGLGEKTGIDLPNEAANLVENLNSSRDIEHATASYGQGIATTPIATVRALSALGNGGFLIQPRVVSKINYRLGFSKDVTIEVGRQVIKKETSKAITDMLVTAVDKGLVGGTYSIPNYSVAAKTGTAQIANHATQKYYSDRFLHSFFGYFPAYDPKFLVFLFMVNPHGAQFASETLPAPFFGIAKFLIHYYEIPPDR